MACHWLHGSPGPPLLFPTDSSSQVSVRNQRFRLDHTTRLYDMWEDPTQQKDVFPNSLRSANNSARQQRNGERRVRISRQGSTFTIGDPHHLQTLLPGETLEQPDRFNDPTDFPTTPTSRNGIARKMRSIGPWRSGGKEPTKSGCGKPHRKANPTHSWNSNSKVSDCVPGLMSLGILHCWAPTRIGLNGRNLMSRSSSLFPWAA